MILDPKEEFAKFEEKGEEAVALAVAQGNYNDKRDKLAKMWLKRKSDARKIIDHKTRNEWKRPAIIVALGMLILAFLTFVLDFTALFSRSAGVDQATSRPVTNEISAAVESAPDEVSRLHQFLVEKHPSATAFKFLTYSFDDKSEGTPEDQGEITAFSATQNLWNQFSKYRCGYPDQALIQTDFDQEIAFSACGFPSWVVPANEFREVEVSNIQFRLHFFDSDRMVTTNVVCDCRSIYFTDPVFELDEKALTFSVGGDIASVNISGYPSLSIGFPKKDFEDWQSYPVTRLQIRYDSNWIPVSFEVH